MVLSGVRAATLMAYEVVLDRFSQQFGTCALASLSSDDIARFLETPIDTLDGLRAPSPAYKAQALNLVKAMFHRGGSVDPFPGLQVNLPSSSASVQMFSVGQVEAMLKVARPGERGMVAMAIFGGFRPYELEQMSAESVDLEARTILVAGKLSLERRADVLSEFGSDGQLPCLPPIIFDWLKESPFKPQRWQPIHARIANAIDSWVPNGCRMTAIAYCAASHGVAAALMLMTRSACSGCGDRRNIGLVSRDEAARFYALTPKSVIPKP